jgi:eukaryotic-like serine/threonine-protein kinase
MYIFRAGGIQPMAENRILQERYHIKHQLGEGGMGKTYLALDNQTGYDVVVKQLHLQHTKDWKVIDLFEKEAKLLRNLDHPFIPDYIDSFYIDTESDRVYVLVQEYVEGMSLREKVESGWRCNEAEATAILEHLLEILIYLHGLRPPIIHRDINPDNIILTPDNTVYLVDFGAVQDTLRVNVLGGSTVVGTYGYMPMEQMIGKAKPASDLYALGVSLIYLLTHVPPDQIPLKEMRLDYKEWIQDSSPLTRLIDRLIEPDVDKRLGDASKALETLHRKPTFPDRQQKAPHAHRDRISDAELDLYELQPPYMSRIRAEFEHDRLNLYIPGSGIRGAPILIFAIFWLGFISVWTSITLFAFLPMAFFSLPFWGVGIFLLASGIGRMQPATIQITPEDIYIQKGGIQIPKAYPIPLHHIGGASTAQPMMRAKGSVPPSNVIAIQAGAKTIKIDKGLSEAEAEWVCHVLHAYLREYAS